MTPDYKNWIPRWMSVSAAAACAATGAATVAAVASRRSAHRGSAVASRRNSRAATAGRANTAHSLKAATLPLTALAFAGSSLFYGWTIVGRRAFDYARPGSVAQRIVSGVSKHITCPEGGRILDVGCGSGALSIACARRNPSATVVGVDRWGVDYLDYSARLCERNAAAEGVTNCVFCPDDATHLDFPDESFDAVTSNYVYHNVFGVNKQDLLRETLRVLKKGGVFAIHDLMSPLRYGNMDAFVRELRDAGFERVELLETSRGLFFSPREAAVLQLRGSFLLTGRK